MCAALEVDVRYDLSSVASLLASVIDSGESKFMDAMRLQRDEIVGKGVTAQTTAGNPKGTLQDRQPAHECEPTMQEQELTNRASSSQPRQETPNAH